MVLRQGYTSLLARSVLDAGSGIDQVSFSELAMCCENFFAFW